MTKKYVFNFCYLIRILLEHKKFSDMWVWVLSFGRKLRLILVQKGEYAKSVSLAHSILMIHSIHFCILKLYHKIGITLKCKNDFLFIWFFLKASKKYRKRATHSLKSNLSTGHYCSTNKRYERYCSILSIKSQWNRLTFLITIKNYRFYLSVFKEKWLSLNKP